MAKTLDFLKTDQNNEGVSNYDFGNGQDLFSNVDQGNVSNSTPEVSRELKPQLNTDKSKKTLFTGIGELVQDPVKYTPYVGGAIEAKQMAGLLSSANRLKDGKATDDDRIMLQNFINDAERDKTFGYKAFSVIRQLPAYAIEIYSTGGAYTAVKEGTIKSGQKVLEKLLTKEGKKLLESQLEKSISGKAAKFTGKLALKSAGAVAGMTAVTPISGSTRILAGTFERMLPEMQLSEDDKRQAEILIKDNGEDVYTAAVQSFGSNWVELVSERSGGLFTELASPIRNKILKTVFVKQFLKLNPSKKVGNVMNIVNKAGWNGVINEMLEERVADVGHGALTKFGLDDQEFKLPSLEQLAVEAVAFSVPGAAINVANIAERKQIEKEAVDNISKQTGLDRTQSKLIYDDIIKAAEESKYENMSGEEKQVVDQVKGKNDGVDTTLQNIINNAQDKVVDTDYKATRIFHQTSADPTAIREGGFTMGENSKWGTAAWFSAAPKTEFGDNTLDFDASKFSLKTFNTPADEDAYIEKFGGKDLADAVRNEGKYDGFVIPQPNPADTTIAIVNQEKLDENLRSQITDLRREEFITTEEAEKTYKSFPFVRDLKLPLRIKSKIMTPEGKHAFGRYSKGMTEFINNPHKSTPSHEAIHAYMDLMMDSSQKQTVLNEVKRRYAGEKLSDAKAEERLADGFIDYLQKKKAPSNKLKQFFDWIIKNIKKLAGASDKINDFYKEVETNKPTQLQKVEAAEKVLKGYNNINDVRSKYQEEPDALTTKFLEHGELKNRKTASYQFLSNLLKSKSLPLKNIERDLIGAVLESEFKDKKNISIKDLRDAVIQELMPIEMEETTQWSDYGVEDGGRTISRGLTNDIENTTTFILKSDVLKGLSDNHFNEDGYFAHIRVAFMIDNTAKVLEIQSDVFQKKEKDEIGFNKEATLEKSEQRLADIVNKLSAAKDQIGNISKAIKYVEGIDEITDEVAANKVAIKIKEIARAYTGDMLYTAEDKYKTKKEAIATLEDYKQAATNDYNKEKEKQSKELSEIKASIKNLKKDVFTDEQKYLIKKKPLLDFYYNNWHEMAIKQAIRLSANADKVQFPTAFTATKIEDWDGQSGEGGGTNVEGDVEVGNTVYVWGEELFVTDVWDDGSFQGVRSEPDATFSMDELDSDIENMIRDDARYNDVYENVAENLSEDWQQTLIDNIENDSIKAKERIENNKERIKENNKSLKDIENGKFEYRLNDILRELSRDAYFYREGENKVVKIVSPKWLKTLSESEMVHFPSIEDAALGHEIMKGVPVIKKEEIETGTIYHISSENEFMNVPVPERIKDRFQYVIDSYKNRIELNERDIEREEKRIETNAQSVKDIKEVNPEEDIIDGDFIEDNEELFEREIEEEIESQVDAYDRDDYLDGIYGTVVQKDDGTIYAWERSDVIENFDPPQDPDNSEEVEENRKEFKANTEYKIPDINYYSTEKGMGRNNIGSIITQPNDEKTEFIDSLNGGADSKSFKTREEAIKYADEFFKKEGVETKTVLQRYPNIDDQYQGIAHRYQTTFGAYLQKLRGKDNFGDEVVDQYGFDWYETNIVEGDKDAVEAFQTEDSVKENKNKFSGEQVADYFKEVEIQKIEDAYADTSEEVDAEEAFDDQWLYEKIYNQNFTLRRVDIRSVLEKEEKLDTYNAANYVDDGENRYANEDVEEGNLDNPIIIGDWGDGTYGVMDGYNRLLAHLNNDRKTIYAYVADKEDGSKYQTEDDLNNNLPEDDRTRIPEDDRTRIPEDDRTRIPEDDRTRLEMKRNELQGNIANREIQSEMEIESAREYSPNFSSEELVGYENFKAMANRRKWMLDNGTDEAMLKNRIPNVDFDNTLFSGANEMSNDELLELFKAEYYYEQSQKDLAREKTPTEQYYIDKAIAERAVRDQSIPRNATLKQAIKVAIGNAPSRKITKSERQLLKMRISAINTGVRMGRQDMRNIMNEAFTTRFNDIRAIKQALVEFAKPLPLSEKGKLLDLIKNAKTKKDLVKGYVRIDDMLERADKRGEIEKLKKQIKTVKKATKTGKGIAVDYQKKVLDIVENYSITNSTQKTIDDLLSLADYIKKNPDLNIPDRVVDRLKALKKMNPNEMSVEGFRELNQTIMDLISIGKLKLKLQNSYNERTRQANADRVANSTFDIDKNPDAYLSTIHSFRVLDIMDGYQNYDGENVRMGKNIGGAIINAKAEESEGMTELLEKLSLIKDEWTKDEQAKIAYWSAVEQGKDYEAAIFMKEMGWETPPILTNDEAEALALLRSVFEKNEDRLVAIYEERENKPFVKSQNYLPIKYERKVGEIDEPTVGQNFFGRKSEVEQGFTVSRKKNVKRILRWDIFNAVAEEYSNQMYYVNVQPVLSEIQSIITTETYKNAAGIKAMQYWKDYIDAISNRGYLSRSEHNATLARIRMNLSKAILGYKASTVIRQLDAIFDGISYVHANYGEGAAIELLARFTASLVDPTYNSRAKKRSAGLRSRSGAGELSIKELQNDGNLTGLSGETRLRRLGKGFQDLSFSPMKILDMKVASAVRNTMYRVLKAKGLSDSEASSEADFIMRLTQGSSEIADRPMVLMKGEGLRTLLTFQTFVLNRFGIIAHDLVMGGIVKGNFAKKLRSVFALVVYFSLGTALWDQVVDALNALIKGQPARKAKNFAVKALMQIPETIPVLGSWLRSLFEYNASPSIPIVSVVEKFVRGIMMLGSENEETRVRGALNIGESSSSLMGIAGTAQGFDMLERYLVTDATKNVIPTTQGRPSRPSRPARIERPSRSR